MAKYLEPSTLQELQEVQKIIFGYRNKVYEKYQIDILDTDALSSLSIYQIVSQYDPDYNINFARNGEDGKSKDVLIETKASRVADPFTKRGKLRKAAGTDAVFQFHVMGDLEHPRYLFVARNKNSLKLMRIYDIAKKKNTSKILNFLLGEREAWLARSQGNEKLMKRDVISLPEKFLIENIKFNSPSSIDDCVVYKDW
jgi:hypothetical protein